MMCRWYRLALRLSTKKQLYTTAMLNSTLHYTFPYLFREVIAIKNGVDVMWG